MHAETGNSTNEEGAAEVDVEILRCPLVLTMSHGTSYSWRSYDFCGWN